jgi:putative oxidoreductase
MRRILFGGATINPAAADFGLMLFRVAIGLGLALAHGWAKIFETGKMAGFTDGVANLGFPMPVVFAWAAALAECLGGFTLAAGLATRISAFFITVTMCVAFFLRHAEDLFKDKEKAYLYGAAAVLFLFVGAGRFSIDHLFRRR